MCNYLSMLRLKLNDDSKRGHWWHKKPHHQQVWNELIGLDPNMDKVHTFQQVNKPSKMSLHMMQIDGIMITSCFPSIQTSPHRLECLGIYELLECSVSSFLVLLRSYLWVRSLEDTTTNNQDIRASPGDHLGWRQIALAQLVCTLCQLNSCGKEMIRNVSIVASQEIVNLGPSSQTSNSNSLLYQEPPTNKIELLWQRLFMSSWLKSCEWTYLTPCLNVAFAAIQWWPSIHTWSHVDQVGVVWELVTTDETHDEVSMTLGLLDSLWKEMHWATLQTHLTHWSLGDLKEILNSFFI